ncbi:MAG TPA: hypothetical protein PKJ65_06925, partial [Clostridia bacterium]|nr:hypothetical protein [Clostridia bacterium]
MEKKRKSSVILIIAMLILLVSCNKNSFDVTTFNSDITIKRSDAQEPLNIPYRYSKALLDKRTVYSKEITDINISSVAYEISDTGLCLHNYEEVLKDPESDKTAEVIDSIKY